MSIKKAGYYKNLGSDSRKCRRPVCDMVPYCRVAATPGVTSQEISDLLASLQTGGRTRRHQIEKVTITPGADVSNQIDKFISAHPNVPGWQLRQRVNVGLKSQAWSGDLRRIVRSGVLGRTRQYVTDIWFGRTTTTVIEGEEHRCSRTWINGLRSVVAC